MTEGFSTWLKESKAAKQYATIAFLLCIAYYVLEYINGRAQMADFRVYYDAANAFIHNTQLYGKAFGVSSGFYKYSPFAALPFIPLAILPYAIASGIYYLLMTFAFIWWPLYLLYYIATTQVTIDWKKTGLVIFFSVLFLADHIERELHLGNVNLLLLILTFFSYTALSKGKSTTAGILIGIVLLFKPHFVILLPLLIWKGKWKTLLVVGVTVLLGFITPALFKGGQGNLALHQEWIQTMRLHNTSLEDSPNTIYGIVNSFLLQGSGSTGLVVLLLSLVAALYIWLLVRNRKVFGNSDIRFMEYFILVAAIPNLTHTDTEHFMWTWPLIAYSILSLSTLSLKKYWPIVILLVLAFVPYCLNSPDIVGKEIRYLFDEGGLLGVANLILIAVSVYLFIHSKSHNIVE